MYVHLYSLLRTCGFHTYVVFVSLLWNYEGITSTIFFMTTNSKWLTKFLWYLYDWRQFWASCNNPEDRWWCPHQQCWIVHRCSCKKSLGCWDRIWGSHRRWSQHSLHSIPCLWAVSRSRRECTPWRRRWRRRGRWWDSCCRRPCARLLSTTRTDCLYPASRPGHP